MKEAFRAAPEELLAKTGTDREKGLTPEQVEKSRNTYGSNSFVRQGHESLAKKIWDASTEPTLGIALRIARGLAVRWRRPMGWGRRCRSAGRWMCGSR